MADPYPPYRKFKPLRGETPSHHHHHETISGDYVSKKCYLLNMKLTLLLVQSDSMFVTTLEEIQ